MKLSTVLRKKVLPLVLMYSIASILCCLTVPLMVPMATGDAPPPHDVTFWVDPNVTGGVAPNGKVTVDIRINATGPAAIIGWKLYIQVNPDVLTPGWQELPMLPWKWAEANKSGYFLYDWSTAKGYTNAFDEGARDETGGTVGTPAHPVLESVHGWSNFTQGTGANGTGKLVTIYFTSKNETAYTPILIKEAYYYTSWKVNETDPTDEHEPNIIHGHYNDPTDVHDVAVRSVATSAPSVHRGDMVKFSVQVFNPGAYTETFNVTFSYNKTAQWEFIGNYSFTLDLLENKTKPVTEPPIWDTEYVEPGNYTINATATLYDTDTWTGDNVTKSFITTEKPVPDSEKVYVNQTLMTKPANYTIDYETGNITFTTAPGSGVEIKAIYLLPDVNPANNVANTTIWVKPPPYDVAVTAISAPPTATAGDTVQINVTAANLGTAEPVNLTVTVSYDSEIGEDNATLVDPDTTRDFTFQWTTSGVSPGTYNITARVSLWAEVGWDDKIQFNDENKTTITITPAAGGDAAVTSVVPAKSWAYPTWTVPLEITVTVLNNGSAPDFTVTAYNDTTEIGTQNVTDLAPDTPLNLTFSWTVGGAYGGHTIKANATLAGDINPGNNEKDVTVKVRWPGDCNDSGFVDLDDFMIFLASWFKGVGQAGYDQRADFNANGFVDLDDFMIFLAHWFTEPP